jgi:hypothetical protein
VVRVVFSTGDELLSGSFAEGFGYGFGMTDRGEGALATALAYHRAWTGHDFELAMTYVSDHIVCFAPAGRLDGAEAFRGFMDLSCRFLRTRKWLRLLVTTRRLC